MCEAKPGRRCAADTAQDARDAHTQLTIEEPFAPSVDPVTSGAPRFDASDLPRWDETSRPFEAVGGAAETEAVADWEQEDSAWGSEGFAEALEEGNGTETAPSPAPSPQEPEEDPQPDPHTQEVFQASYDTKEERYEAYRAELDKADQSLAETEHWRNYLKTLSQFHQYSHGNRMMIRLQRPNATQCASYRKWQALGRQVNEGEKGIKIWAPIKYQKTVTDANGQPVRDEKGNLKKEEQLSFRTVNTFDVSQTSGEDYTMRHSELSTTPPEGFQKDLETTIKDEGYTVRYGPMEEGLETRGYTHPIRKEVYIREDMPPAAQVTTLAHELGHIKAGHLEKMDEYRTHRGSMEIEAESIGYVLCRSNGMKDESTNDQASSYVKIWGRAATKEQMREAAVNVSSVVKDILGSGKFRNADKTGGKASE